MEAIIRQENSIVGANEVDARIEQTIAASNTYVRESDDYPNKIVYEEAGKIERLFSLQAGISIISISFLEKSSSEKTYRDIKGFENATDDELLNEFMKRHGDWAVPTELIPRLTEIYALINTYLELPESTISLSIKEKDIPCDLITIYLRKADVATAKTTQDIQEWNVLYSSGGEGKDLVNLPRMFEQVNVIEESIKEIEWDHQIMSKDQDGKIGRRSILAPVKEGVIEFLENNDASILLAKLESLKKYLIVLNSQL